MPTFEPAQLSQWLHTCETKHSLCSEAGSRSDAPVLSLRFDESATSNFRLVDLERACIVEASLDSRYVVLSYVGVEGKLKLTSANYEQLSAEGVLADPNIHTALPAVIRDAFGLVQAIGERYLWVDALCLLHDDKDDINVGVSLQYAVFRHSLFTIVAAAGDAGPSLYDSIINSDNTVDAALALSSSVHARRAWTLGEVALSQRAVLLAQKCVFFCCRQGTCVWLDNCLVPVSGKSPINCIPSPVDSIRPCLTSYVQLSQEYSRRVLSRDGDALRAFHGIGRPLFAGMRTVSVEGLPAYYVNAFLLFKTTSAETSRRREFASYSWAGWCGGMEWLLTGSDGDTGPSTATDIVRWLQNNSLVEWDDLTTTGQVHRLRQWRLAGYDGSLSPPSNLAKFLEEHAHLFGGKIAGLSAARIDDTVISPEDDLIYGSGSHARLDKVDWWKDVLCEDKPIAPARFPRWAFDLVASRGQLERLQRQLDSGGGVNEKAARSWTASRWATKRGGNTSKPVSDNDTPSYRPPRLAEHDEEEQEREFADPRAKNARKAAETSGDAINIPVFPPYSVLVGWAVQFSLVLGASVEDVEDDTAAKELPLLSASGTVVGTLYPDDTSLLPQSGSKVDLLILGRNTLSSTNNSLWALFISWHDGVAERRGVGRVPAAAMGGAVEGPDIKRVLLG